jgi:hypothetical protein
MLKNVINKVKVVTERMQFYIPKNNKARHF